MNKGGVSGIITMLIIVTLVLVATGGVWVVVKNILETSSEEVEISSSRLFQKCSDLGYEKMFEGWNCDGEIIYAGGEKCCTGDAKSDKELLESLGAISWWRFEGDANDEIGDNNGSLEGGVDCSVNGKYGKACEFDGVDDFINCGNDVSLHTSGAVTQSAWINPKGVSGSNLIIREGQGTDMQYGMYVTNGGLLFHYYTGTSFPGISTAPIITQDIWTHVAIVRESDGLTLHFYVDGVLVKTETASLPTVNTGGLLSIGGHTNPAVNQFFNGTIDDIMIFNKALTEDEVKTLYGLELS